MEVILDDIKFNLIKDYKNAFDKEDLEKRYISECFNKFDYLVCDYSAGILRIKGFSKKPGKNNYKTIPDYINESCTYDCPFYILKK